MSSKRILIVEDEAVVALDLRMQLEDMGYAITGIAASGEAALTAVEQNGPDLVLMDVRLQGKLDGIEAAAELRRTSDTPVIFLTAHNDTLTVERAAQTAPYGFVTKPFQPRELRAGIEVALAKHRLERQLQESDRWFSHTMRCVHDAIVLVEPDRSLRFMNPAAEALTGWRLEDATGRPVDDLLRFATPDADAMNSMQQALARALGEGRPLELGRALPLLARDGSTVYVDGSAGPVHDDNGQALGAVLVLRSAAPRLAQELALRTSEASELANRAKNEFISRVSHEMRTPLNAVLGFAQLLQMDSSAGAAKVDNYAEQIRIAGEHLLHIVTDLLDLQRAAQGDVKVEMADVPLAPVLALVQQFLSAPSQAQRITVSVAAPDGLVVRADATRLRQVLLNLASNAVKYNRPGGAVHITAERLPPVAAPGAAVAGRVLITVRDEGIGMTAEQLAHLFEPFQRLGREHSGVPGTGLGLVISRSLVTSMGGTLEVTSQPRAGTVVRLELDATAPPAAG